MPSTLSPLTAAPDAPTDQERTDDSLRKAAADFESLFIHQLFQSMRRTVPDDGLGSSGMGGEIFTDLLDDEYAKAAASRGGFGLAEILSQQLGVAEEGLTPGQLNTSMSTSEALRRYAEIRVGAKDQDKLEGSLMTPVEGRNTSGFGMRKLGGDADARLHAGMDFGATTGTPIHAADDGVVVFSGTQRGYGNTVVLEHSDGFRTLYGHASELLVAVGDQVARGTPIARVGSTGHSTGPHLHFEVRKGGQPVDPAGFLSSRPPVGR